MFYIFVHYKEETYTFPIVSTVTLDEKKVTCTIGIEGKEKEFLNWLRDYSECCTGRNYYNVKSWGLINDNGKKNLKVTYQGRPSLDTVNFDCDGPGNMISYLERIGKIEITLFLPETISEMFCFF